MTKQTENEQKFKKFFFGKMAEDERFAFENEFAADYELLEEMRAFEADLIEKYVRGFMNSVEKSEFETHFLNTEKRRNKVEFSRRLIAELRQETKIEAEKESFWNRFGKLFLTPKFAFGTAFASLVLIFGSWFLTRNSEVEKTEIVKNENSANVEIANKNINVNVEKNAVNSNQNTQSNLETNSNKQANNKPTPTKTPEPKLTPTPQPSKTPTPETPKIAPNPVLALFAGTLRADGEINELNLPKNASGATFRLNLKTVDYKIFQAEITDGNGKIVYRSGNLKPQKSSLNLFVPAKNLRKGDYRINLYGKNSAGENESAADFQFRVN